jgi:hypothetical protein
MLYCGHGNTFERSSAMTMQEFTRKYGKVSASLLIRRGAEEIVDQKLANALVDMANDLENALEFYVDWVLPARKSMRGGS